MCIRFSAGNASEEIGKGSWRKAGEPSVMTPVEERGKAEKWIDEFPTATQLCEHLGWANDNSSNQSHLL